MLKNNEKIQLDLFAAAIRCETLKSIAAIGIGHIGGSLSIAELLAVLYQRVMDIDPHDPKKEDRDYFVCSKGHAGPAVYSTLALRGYFPLQELSTLNQLGTSLPSHCDMRKTVGIDMTTGSLGQGASAACGIALGNRLKWLDNYTFALFGDGELQEGQIWESMMFSAHHHLNHLICFVDKNNLQIDGTTDEICSLGDLKAKFQAFGIFVQEIDGHDTREIYLAILTAKQKNCPSVIILNTIKGRGVSIFENKPSNHNAEVSKEILELGLNEQAEIIKELECAANVCANG
ncbi:MAG TPA: transketolase [Clostridiales bacterium]|nr:transketolase [Clostridiales bacterium]